MSLFTGAAAGPRARLWRPLVSLALLVFVTGCTFGGYVPPPPPPRPLAESEMNIPDLALGESVVAELDCFTDECRGRHRVIVPAAGVLKVSVNGPVSAKGQGARIARVVLEGIGQRVLKTRFGDEGPPPVQITNPVQRGVHFVLVQGLGGPIEYDIVAYFEPSDTAVVEPGGADPPSPLGRAPAPALPPMGKGAKDLRAEPGDLSDGADFAYDPRRDLKTMTTYAFAQDPAAMLRTKQASSEGDPFVLRQIQREVRYYLADRAVYAAPTNEADLLVTVHVYSQSGTWYSVGSMILQRPYDYYFNAWGRAGVAVRPHSYMDGTLIINFIDRKTGELLWHGWTTEPVSMNATGNEQIKEAVIKVLDQY
jgi:hypothetical protein